MSKSSTPTQFHQTVKYGQQGENEFHSLYPWLIKTQEHSREDFQTPTGEKVELKSDNLAHDTENAYLEIMDGNNKPSGLFRAKELGIEYFVYYLTETKECIWLNTNQLYNAVTRELLDGYAGNKSKGIRLHDKYNNTWKVTGMIVPMNMVKLYQIEAPSFGTPSEPENTKNDSY